MATKKNAKNSTAITPDAAGWESAAAFAEKIDRDNLPAKTRVHALAKQLGMPSRQLVGILAERGVQKIAQSTLTPEEVEETLDFIAKHAAAGKSRPGKNATETAAAESNQVEGGGNDAAAEGTQPGAGADTASNPAAVAEEKLRTRVRKNVDNELSQIKDKVDAELEAGEAAEPVDESDKLREQIRNNVANEISQIEEKVNNELRSSAEEEEQAVDEAEQSAEEAEESAETGNPEDLAGDAEAADFMTTPPATPMPADDSEGYDYAPIFLAPTVENEGNESGLSTAEDEEEAEADAEAEEALAAVMAAAEASDTRSSSQEGERSGGRRRRGRRGTSRGRGPKTQSSGVDRDENGVEIIDEPKAIRGSTRIEARRRRRAEMRGRGRERDHIVSQAEFLARRESVERLMVVRDRKRDDGPGLITQVGVLEDGLLVEHFVTSEAQASIIGNVYLGRVQNVLPSMEAAFVDIGTGRNGVLYAGDFDWRGTGLGGRARKIENALKSGDQVLVQVSKDPIGHKGARLTTQISLAGRFLVYVPKGKNAGISRKLPAPERKRLKSILGRVVPEDGGAIIRTAAEGVSEEAIGADVRRLHDLWADISKTAKKEKKSKGAKPVTLYEEPDTLIKVVRDLFNEDFDQLVVDGKRAFNTVNAYVNSVAPDLSDRLVRFDRRHNNGDDAFAAYRIDEQLHKALSRKVWLPSGGTLIIDRTEAMTVIDVNTGKFTGSGGNLEETVTKNNLEAAEEIVRQMRLRDLGGMIVVDFIDMVLPENQELVLRRLKEALGRDRTRHQVSEVTSLGLVQMTRKRLGTGLLETFSTECEHCHGRGIIIHDDPVEEDEDSHSRRYERAGGGSPSHQGDKARRHSLDDDAPRVDTDRDANGDSDSDGDADENRGKRSRRRNNRRDNRRRRRSESGQRKPETSIEDLADSVIAHAADDDADSDTAADSANAVQNVEEPRRGKNRRSRRRRAARRATRSANENHRREKSRTDDEREKTARDERGDVSAIESIAYAAVDIANNAEEADFAESGAGAEMGAADTEVASHAEAGSAGQSYAEAINEFERSPRRKRRTRGNSRSDHRPQPEDFSSEEDSRESESPDQADKSARSDQGDIQGEHGDNPGDGVQRAEHHGQRRRRRRAVRRAAQKNTRQRRRDSARVNKRGEEQKTEQRNEDANAEAYRDSDSERQSRGGRHRRRRATRRASSNRADAQDAPSTSTPQAERKDEDRSKKRDGGRGRSRNRNHRRGRRRATRHN